LDRSYTKLNIKKKECLYTTYQNKNYAFSNNYNVIKTDNMKTIDMN